MVKYVKYKTIWWSKKCKLKFQYDTFFFNHQMDRDLKIDNAVCKAWKIETVTLLKGMRLVHCSALWIRS